MSILLLDNYDSFTYNLKHLVEKVGEEEVIVKRNDEIELNQINNYSSIILSPGPGLPKDAGIMPDLLKQYFNEKKILGVCLGMQAIGEFFGAELKNLNKVVHGEAVRMDVIEESPLFKNCPANFFVARYHSWVIDNSLPVNELQILAEDEEQEIMAIQHINLPIYGVQFHPESILSQYGENLMKNWLSL
ncbi:MAG: aminodeoxychorismate/anthranilate synthase component II [Bacteroidetes bacterium]|nr:aminodeoxychorismate/anthranilate synthase component II [Bacteroidota bacterium]